MTPTPLQGPAIEPVPLADMKAYLRLSGDDEDALLSRLIAAARLAVESASGCELIAQTWRLSLDRWPRSGVVRLPLKPVLGCLAVRVFADATTSETLDPADYQLDARSSPARLALSRAPPQPGRAASGIEIDIEAGFGAAAADVPANLRQAVALIAARWFERRGDDPAAGEPPLPPEAVALIAPFRAPRLIP
jgi:uncharacterized phiE125 gp8 family phage protein